MTPQRRPSPLLTRPRTAVAALAAALLVTACNSTSPDPSGTPSATDPASASASETGADVEIPDSPVGSQAQWVLDTLATDGAPSAEEAQQHFSAAFLAELPADQAAAVFDQIRATGPYTLESYEEAVTNGRMVLSGADGARFNADLAIDGDGAVASFLVSPVPEVPAVSGPEEADAAIEGSAQESSFLLATIEGEGADATCVPQYERNSEALLPTGSMFKLWVLGAVAEAVNVGSLTWDDTLTVTEESKSLPSGELQDQPAGTEVSVREAADAMISISDNTATDLLIEAVGREAVEAQLAAAGHSAPEVNIPFLTTREMFHMSFGDPALGARWAQASGVDRAIVGTPAGDVPEQSADPAVSAAQREVLAGLPAWDRSMADGAGAVAFWPLGLDWYASAQDLCRAQVHLADLATTDGGAPIPEILAIDPAIELPDAESIGFKGGSSVGEIGGSWIVEREDGTREVLTIQTAGADATAVPQPQVLIGIAQQALGGEKPE